MLEDGEEKWRDAMVTHRWDFSDRSGDFVLGGVGTR